MGLLRGSKKEEFEDDEDDFDEDKFEEDPWYRMDIRPKKKGKKKDHPDENWDGMEGLDF